VRLRIILIVLSILAFLSVSIAGYIYYSSLEKEAFKEAEKEVALQAVKIQKTLSDYLSENLKSVKALAGLTEMKQALQNPERDSLDRANVILDHFSETLDVDVTYLMDRLGNTVASSNRGQPDSFVGENFSFRPYWELAIHGSPATYMALGIRSKKRGVYYSHPVYGDGIDAPLGVAVIKSPVSRIEGEFSRAFEGAVLLTDPHGIAFISNRRDWLYRSLWKLSPGQVKKIADSQQFGEGPWEWIGMEIESANIAADERGNKYLIYQMEVENYPGWKVIYLRSLRAISNKISGPLIRASGPIIAMLCLLIGGSVFFLYSKASGDIVRRKEAEEGLRSAKEELGRYSQDLERQVRERTREITNILRYTPAVVYIKDSDGRYTFINSRYEELFGVRNAEIKGKTDYDIFPSEVADQFRANDEKIFAGKEPCQVEEQVPQEDGTHVYLSVKFPIFDEEGKILFLCGISTDITEIKKAQDQLRRLSDSIMESQEKERAAVSRELHDELGQVLTALRMDSVWLRQHLEGLDGSAADRAGEMCDLIDKAIDEVRSMATRLRPGVLDDLGLIDALDWHTADFEKRTKIACTFQHQNVPMINDTVATAAYRIAQETLTNVARHAFATRVDVTIEWERDILTLAVTDNGRGFDTRILSETDGLGVAGMRERAALIGGTLEILSQPGEGTRVYLRAPVDGKREVLH
jgi:PAS domain S-box-containing protein